MRWRLPSSEGGLRDTKSCESQGDVPSSFQPPHPLPPSPYTSISPNCFSAGLIEITRQPLNVAVIYNLWLSVAHTRKGKVEALAGIPRTPVVRHMTSPMVTATKTTLACLISAVCLSRYETGAIGSTQQPPCDICHQQNRMWIQSLILRQREPRRSLSNTQTPTGLFGIGAFPCFFVPAVLIALCEQSVAALKVRAERCQSLFFARGSLDRRS